MTRGRIWLALIVAFGFGLMVAGGGAWILGRGGQPPVIARSAVRYQCPMHPTMISDRPGDCPICGMRMIPIQERSAAAHPAPASAPAPGPPVEGRAPVHLSLQKRQLIGVTSEPVTRRRLSRTIRTIGRVTYDETRLHHVHTKVGGYVERLHANTTGELVRRGQPLLSIYSPELLASAQEYILALKARDRLGSAADPAVRASGDALVQSARRRLLLYDLAPAQIEELERTGEAPRTTTLPSPVTGHIVMRNVQEGQKIDSGTTVLDIANLERVWVMADVYEYEMPLIRLGQRARVTLSYLPGRAFEGNVSFISPVLSETTRTVKVRVELPNPDLALKPEMFADVQLESDLGEGLAVPRGAVLSTGDKDVVFVDRGEGHFEPRQVVLGARLDDAIQILRGLDEGDRVVTSGNFLLDSESRLEAAVGAHP
ncbi:MAG: efflux RND transporter periplasmic adaptor subunit [Candidatus Polarisedimenticolia bacterium]